MIECAYGRKFPELVLHFDGNLWIESYSIQLKKTQWRNRKTGQIVKEKPANLSSLKNMKMHVTLPTHPFIYSSKFGTWSNATFENGDEDYFEEISIGPCLHRGNHSSNNNSNNNNNNTISSSSSIFDQEIKRKQQTKESRALINDAKEIRRNSSSSRKGLKLCAESAAAATSTSSNNNKPDSPRATMNSSRLSSARLSVSLTGTTATPRTPVASSSISTTSAVMIAENQAHAAESLARDEAKSKHHTQLGSHFVKPGGSALQRGSLSASVRKLSISTSSSNIISESNDSSSNSKDSAAIPVITTNTTATASITLDSISEDISLSHKASIFSPTRKEAYSNKKFGESTDDDEDDNNPISSSGGGSGGGSTIRRPPPPPPPPPRLQSPRDATAGAVVTSSGTVTPLLKLSLPAPLSSAEEDDDDDDDEDEYNVSSSSTKPTVAANLSPDPHLTPPSPPISPRQLASVASTNCEVQSSKNSNASANVNHGNEIKGSIAAAIVRPPVSGTGAVLDATQRNKEFFKRVKEQEDEEKRRKEQESIQLDASTLAAMKEQELSADLHNNEKTKHYAKLGSTFAVKGPAGNAILQSRSKVTATTIPSTSSK